MKKRIIEQVDEEGNVYNWIAIDKQTALELWENECPLYYVREDAEGLIEDEEDLQQAISHNSVCIDDSYLWREEFEEGEQNRHRNNDFISFDEWVEQKIESYY